ncbi:hypothetical protein EFE42_09970, partial [Methanohalophilus sp. RSK]
MVTPAAAFSGDGWGTSTSPYEITNVDELQEMNDDLDEYYILMNDIVASDTVNWNSGAGFVPIGSKSNEFTGDFDGQGHTITGLYINRPDTNYVGLFGYTSHASISNVGLEDVDVTGNSSVGGLVGYFTCSMSKPTITKIYSTGDVTGNEDVGGLVGHYTGSSYYETSITKSYSTVDVAGNEDVGGLVGHYTGDTDYDFTITQSNSTGTVTGNEDVGGLVGWNQGGSVTDSYSTGDVTGDSDYVGGLVGYNSGSVTQSYSTGTVTGIDSVGGLVGENSGSGSVTDSYSTGKVTDSSSFVGGLVGYNSGSVAQSNSTVNVDGSSSVGGLVGGNDEGSVDQSYSTGTVTGSSDSVGGLVGENSGSVTQSYSVGDVDGGSYVGGLVGYSGSGSSINKCYSTGSVTGDSDVGGLVGKNDGTVTDSYWDTETSGMSTSDGGTGLTKSEMQDRLNLSNWDFENIWRMNPYPELKWQPVTFSDGEGTESNPYHITNLDELQNIEDKLDAHYILTSDINASDTVKWNSGAGFEPIGDDTNSFTGNFDGQGHTITDLYIDRSSDIGLFGETYSGASISNVGLENVNVTGSSGVGGLVGENFGSVTQSNSTGYVTGSFDSVGGLVGYNEGKGSTVTECYSTGNVTGSSNVGGLIGYHGAYAVVNQCYSTGNVNASNNDRVGGLIGKIYLSSVNQSYSTGNVTGDFLVGGLVGYNEGGSVNQCYSTGNVTGNEDVGGLVGNSAPAAVNQGYDTVYDIVSDSYWNINTSGQTSSDGGTGLTDAQMQDSSNFVNWDFTNIWGISSGINDGYPNLLNLNYESESVSYFSGGDGSTENPYQIITVNDLQNMSTDLSANYTLMNDIDASGTSSWDGDQGFEPIGNSTNKFTGTFDGNGSVISNLSINRPSTSYVGLFGCADEVASITNVSLEDVNVTGNYQVGGLIGGNAGSVIQCYSSGTVTGSANLVGGLIGKNAGSMIQCYSNSTVTSNAYCIGGLVGYNDGGSVVQCYSTGDFTGSSNGNEVGGLIGYNYQGSVNQSYATGNVTGNQYIGGLVGVNHEGSVNQSYSTGNVTGSVIGGLVGYNNSGSVDQCYWDNETSGQTTSNGGEGKTTEEMTNPYIHTTVYSGWDFENVWDMSIDTNDGYPHLLTLNYETTSPYEGSGTSEDPYQISDVYELQYVINDLDANYILINDIDASGTSDWNSDAGFEPIGDDTNKFTGTFDGNGSVISNLYINRPSTNYVGLFGYIDSSASINNVGLEDVNVNGSSDVGGLGGENNGYVNQSYSTGNVTGSSDVGGLVGENSGYVNQSYSTGTVTSDYYVGGLVGANGGSVNQSYSAGNVTIGIGANVGGLIGDQYAGSVTQSYWDMNTSGQTSSETGIGRTTENMTYPYNSDTTYVDWDFTNIWGIHGSVNDGYPALLSLTNFPPNVSITDPEVNSYVSGTFFVNASITDPDGDSYKSSVYLNNTTGNIDSHTDLPQDNDSVTFDSTSLIDGIYNITWKAYENETDDGLFGFQTINITIDNTEPVLSVNDDTTDEGNFSQDNITCNISFSDANLNISTIAIYNTSDLIDSNTSSISPHTVTFEDLEEGTYQLNATVSDTAGNIAEMTTREIVLDTTSPYINKIVAPSDVNTSETVEICFNVTDYIGVNHSLTEFNITGNASAELTNAGTWYNYTLNVPSDSIDDIVFNATFYDDADNLNASGDFTINVSDNIAPAIQDTVYESDANTSDSFIIGFNVTDNIGVNHSLTEFNITGNASAELTEDGTWYNYTLNVPADSVGDIVFNATFYDDAGNLNASGDKTINVSDNIVPVIQDTVYESDANTSETVEIGFNVTDNIGVNHSLTDFNITGNASAELTKDGTWYNYTLNVPSDSIDDIVFNATFYDDAGNLNASGDKTINVSDNIKPVYNRLDKVTSANTGDNITIKVNATDNIGVEIHNITVDGEEYQMVNDSGNYTHNISIPASDSGTLVSSITYNCSFGDAASNMNSTGDVVIDVFILPIADFSANVTRGTTPLSVEFTDNSSGLVEEWEWNFGEGNTSTDQNLSHVFGSGNFTVNLTVNNSNGTSSKELNIRAAEEPVYVVSPNETELLSIYGDEKNFSINSTLYSSYEWFIDGTPLNGSGVTLYNNNTDDSAHLSYCNVNTSQ